MAYVNAICTKCGKEIEVEETLDADICPYCKSAFVTEKAIALCRSGEKEATPPKKKRHIFRSLGRGLLLTLECFGYLLYVISLMWLFFDIVDGKKK